MSALISRSERSYIQAALRADEPRRADGRGLHDFRAIGLETGVAPLANGSARVNIGVKTAPEGHGGTEVLVAVKLEVESVDEDGAGENGRITCGVSCSPAAYSHFNPNAVEELSYDLTSLLQQTLSHPSLLPENLSILPKVKAWRLHLDAVVIADAGNVYDALFLAARAALWDTKVPRTRAVEYKPPAGRETGKAAVRTDDEGMDVDTAATSGFDTRRAAPITDFELLDYWDEGEPLAGREKWPLCVTMNLLGPLHFVDATSHEEASATLKLLLAFSFDSDAGRAYLQAMRTFGAAEVDMALLKTGLLDGEKYATELHHAMNAKLKEEDARRGEKARAQFANVRS